MTKTSEDYAVLREPTSRQRFAKFAQDQGWTHEQTHSSTANDPVFEDVWSHNDQRTAIHYVEEPRYGAHFVRVRGAGLQDVLHALATKLGFQGRDELLEDASSVESVEEAVRTILKVGIAFPRHDAAAYSVFEAYLQHPDPSVRRATVQALAYHHWPESTDLLAQVVSSDDDSSVVEFAKPILETSRSRQRRT